MAQDNPRQIPAARLGTAGSVADGEDREAGGLPETRRRRSQIVSANCLPLLFDQLFARLIEETIGPPTRFRPHY